MGAAAAFPDGTLSGNSFLNPFKRNWIWKLCVFFLWIGIWIFLAAGVQIETGFYTVDELNQFKIGFYVIGAIGLLSTGWITACSPSQHAYYTVNSIGMACLKLAVCMSTVFLALTVKHDAELSAKHKEAQNLIVTGIALLLFYISLYEHGRALIAPSREDSYESVLPL